MIFDMEKVRSKSNLLPEGFVPNKALGQNFLSSAVIISAILDAAQIDGKRVLEVGPGTGALTEGLLQRSSFLAAVELDGRLSELLGNRFGESLHLLHADVLDADLPALMGSEPWHAVGNLPYYATTPIVLRLLSLLPESMTLMVQQEAAERFFAKPKGRVYGPVSVLTTCFYDAAIAVRAPRSCFNPPPEVDSVVIRLARNNVPVGNAANFLGWVKQAFSMRRKTLFNALQKDDRLPDVLRTLDLPADVRAEALAPQALLQVYLRLQDQ
jgi:16S rRNA (adenine1518-N6/adenine1519-N6)-dimethyltransferase